MRITEAALELGTSPRALRYREHLGLLPVQRSARSAHRSYSEKDLRAIRLELELEQRYDVTPAALAFGLRVLADPTVAAALRELGERIGHLTTPEEAERQRALRWLGRSGMAPPPRRTR